MTTDLKNFSDADLQAELKRRADEAAANAQARRKARVQEIRQMLNSDLNRAAEMMTFLAGSHTRTTCPDSEYRYSSDNIDRCTLCTVLHLLATDDAETIECRLRVTLA